MFFFRSRTFFFSLFFLLLFFTFSRCTRKDGHDSAVSKALSTDRPVRAGGAALSGQKLLYRAAAENGLQNEASVEMLVGEYRENLYGGLFLEQYLSSRIEVSLDKIREHYIANRLSYVRQSNEVRLIHFLTQNEVSAVKIKQALLQYDAELRASLLSEHGVSPVTISPGELPQNLDLLLFGSSTPRGVLGPEQTPFGYHVLEVLEFFPESSFRGLDELYDEISQELYQSQRAALYSHLLDSLAMEYSIDIKKRGGG